MHTMQLDYTKLNNPAYNIFQELKFTEDVVNMKCGETRILYVDLGLIYVEKCIGSVLKQAINKGSLHKLPFDFKLMIIDPLLSDCEKSIPPLFLNRRREIYLCNNVEKMNKKGQIDNPIRIIGSYANVIQDLDLSGNPVEYYVLIYTKGNLYDGTRHFMSTRKLEDIQQILIRRNLKKIITAIGKNNIDSIEFLDRDREKDRELCQKGFIQLVEFLLYYIVALIIILFVYIIDYYK
jgi:hypothetical protein